MTVLLEYIDLELILHISSYTLPIRCLMLLASYYAINQFWAGNCLPRLPYSGTLNKQVVSQMRNSIVLIRVAKEP